MAVNRMPHLEIVARAGTGKSTTLLGAMQTVRGVHVPFKPTPQQKEIWSSINKGPKPDKVIFLAFGKGIAKRLQSDVPPGCEASTNHSMGFSVLRKEYKINPRFGTKRDRTLALLEHVSGTDRNELFQMKMVSPVNQLVRLAKVTLAGWQPATGFNAADVTDKVLDELGLNYDVELQCPRTVCYQYVREVLQAALNPSVLGKPSVDFDDMIWLPIVNGLKIPQYDLLLVDEAQDLNPCQQQLVLAAGRRVVLCGDPKQAIFGFAGAHVDSMTHMTEQLGADSKINSLPLNVTFRCAKAIVAEAQKIVPDYYAWDKNPEGTVDSMEEYDLVRAAKPNDHIICRINAPTVKLALTLGRSGRSATVLGGDIATRLTTFVDGFQPKTVSDLVDSVLEWYETKREMFDGKRNAALILSDMQDKRDCILAFCQACSSLSDVKSTINRMFKDEATEGSVKLSTIHKAKGLEADRVFLIRPELMPHPKASSDWAKGQEQNLKYVAQTRAIRHLTTVNTVGDGE